LETFADFVCAELEIANAVTSIMEKKYFMI
jgi:hypothetical protein